MNFFESQDRVRRHTALLVALFAMAVVALIVMTNLLVMIVFGFLDSQQLNEGGTFFGRMDWRTFAFVSVGVGVVVLAGSLYKIMALSGGGRVVAEALGGQLVPQDTQDPDQRKLLNVVQEMAIASGTPAPPVYVLADEQGINAFAAGFSPRDAVIGVTRGAVDQLSRDQLQGVIAHEFSHIFNGDMRVNLRLVGVLNGILILGILGYYLLHSASFSRGRRSNGQAAAAMLALALGLIVIGFAGTFFGGLIKAAVSRQREFLADASAVQFTRNTDGIAGALKRIGGNASGSKIEHPAAPEVSHAFFAQGVSGFIQGLAATHPPLAERIRRIDPQWDGKFDSSDRADTDRDEQQAANSETMTHRPGVDELVAVATGAAVAQAMTAIDQMGNPRQETIDYSRSLLAELPAAIKGAVREPYGARAVVYSLVLNEGQEVRARQWKQLQDHADVGVYALTRQLMQETDRLDVKYRLPVIDIAMPALKQLSLKQYETFKRNLIELIEMDSSVNLLEWSLQKILFSHLDAQFLKSAPMQARYSDPGQVRKEVELVLSVIAHAGAGTQNNMEQAFGAAAQVLGLGGLALLERDQITVSELGLAVGKLEQLKPLAKSRLLKACAASIWHDRRATPVEVELLRAFASVLDCPMPPAAEYAVANESEKKG